MPGAPSYLRESAGPGWVLVGDAGHFKDPVPGQGISDALRQVDRLAPAIVEGVGSGGGQALDKALAEWWRWRDEDAAEKHWFAADLARAGRVPPVFVEILKILRSTPGGLDGFFDIFNHRVRPSQILTPARLAAATGRLLTEGHEPRRNVLVQTGQIMRDDVLRRRLNRHPAYSPVAPAGIGRDAKEVALLAP